MTITLRRAGIAVGAVTLLVLGVTACVPPAPTGPTAAPIVVEKGIDYTADDGSELKVDACLPGEGGERPAVILVHGGAFSEGDRATMSGACRDLAQQGLAAFAVDYRLLPAIYPAQVDDVAAAVRWLRDPAQVERFGLDGAVSVLGSSAGAIISLSAAAALAAEGAPVASVVALSPAGSLTAEAAELGDPSPELERVVLGYLGCDSIQDCAVAAEASPVATADLLPPTLIVHGSDELIPLAQAELLDEALSRAGIDHDLVVVEGERHGLQLLDGTTERTVRDFLIAHAT